MSSVRRLKYVVEVVTSGKYSETMEDAKFAIGQNIADGIRRQYREVGITPNNEEDISCVQIEISDCNGETIDLIAGTGYFLIDNAHEPMGKDILSRNFEAFSDGIE